jgi:site-specific recombinase XerD
MVSKSDGRIIELWLENQPSPHTRGCYSRDSKSLLKHAKKPLARITFADLQRFAQYPCDLGLAPISRVRTLAAVKSLFAFCHRQRYLPVNPAAELVLPSYENRLAERILPENDIQRMLAAETEPRNRILLRLLYAAGLRVSEASGWFGATCRRKATPAKSLSSAMWHKGADQPSCLPRNTVPAQW